ncbi:elongation factor P--(R)-beta-lysine ligase [Ferrimonas balearica]|uniref:elongation factor P--(R)-beta-lysine ligase n=1 Tax=Ferrimonas balearica TaxID=44012 RepID=UPI001C55D14E|nr:elongation factor P--(R)-beta-lysine ligase [Ferrimonas balearica]MBW3140498.1 elongation factor P--(R)-beta-lysine ligase [Ferrimonas balearica]MBY6107688.1 elongation factor P--(R)-beta-lysine ligase [Ferrimonas balearica]
MSQSWQPTATMAVLKQRAQLMGRIRDFFAERGVWEVETPCLSQAAVTDVHLHNFDTRFVGPGAAEGIPLYLMTSPEYHMKRLLCAGSGSIFQLCRSFRNEEAGRFHNPEFTMLEWYRVGFDHHALMDEMADLLQAVLGCGEPQRMTYAQAFEQALGVNPLEASLAQLKALCEQYGMGDLAEAEQDADTLLQLLFATEVESRIGQTVPAMVYHFPASQAALARIDEQDPRVARRFEVYFKGVELANGFHELADADEQRARFVADNAQRAAHGLPQRPIDEHLIAALAAGLPDCAGVALGIDRLVMLALDAKAIKDVIPFPVFNA